MTLDVECVFFAEVKIKDDRRSAERKQIVEKAEGALTWCFRWRKVRKVNGAFCISPSQQKSSSSKKQESRWSKVTTYSRYRMVQVCRFHTKK